MDGDTFCRRETLGGPSRHTRLPETQKDISFYLGPTRWNLSNWLNTYGCVCEIMKFCKDSFCSGWSHTYWGNLSETLSEFWRETFENFYFPHSLLFLFFLFFYWHRFSFFKKTYLPLHCQCTKETFWKKRRKTMSIRKTRTVDFKGCCNRWPDKSRRGTHTHTQIHSTTYTHTHTYRDNIQADKETHTHIGPLELLPSCSIKMRRMCKKKRLFSSFFMR